MAGSCDDLLTEAVKASIGPGVAAALAEDVGAGDLTAALIDADAVVGAQIVARERLVVCGEPWVNEVFRQLDPSIIVDCTSVTATQRRQMMSSASWSAVPAPF